MNENRIDLLTKMIEANAESAPIIGGHIEIPGVKAKDLAPGCAENRDHKS